MAVMSNNNTFDGDFGDDPEPYGLLPAGFEIDPRLITAILVLAFLLIVIWVMSRAFGEAAAHRRVRDAKRSAAEAIYEEINMALDRALRAPGGRQMDRAQELRDLLQARFSQVIALTTRPLKTLEGLEKALDASEGKIETHDSKPAKIRVAMASEEHRLVVWQSLQKFRAYWDQKAHVLTLIERAQHELAPPRNAIYRLQKLEDQPPVARAKGEGVVVAPAALPLAILAAEAAAKPASPGVVHQLEDRYARLKKALAGRDGGAIRSILTPDFESVDVQGYIRSRDDMIADARAAAADPHRISKTTIRSAKSAGDVAFVDQTYTFRTRRKDSEGATREVEVETQSTDVWLKKMGGWVLRRTTTRHMEQRQDGQVVFKK